MSEKLRFSPRLPFVRPVNYTKNEGNASFVGKEILTHSYQSELLLFFFLYWIISSLTPRHTSENPSYSLECSKECSFFFNRLYHIITTCWIVFAVRSMVLCPKGMIWGEEFLINFDKSDESFLDDVHISFSKKITTL